MSTRISIAIENTDLADAKEMERKYQEIERDDLRNRLVAMANVKTAEDFGLELPSDAYERMAGALDFDSDWADVASTAWYREAQRQASASRYFHWKLEYPEVFYNADGEAKVNSGFNGIIGNPPYVRSRSLSELQKSFFKSRYNSTTGRWDVCCLFTERGIEFSNGGVSYIQPSMFLRRPYGEGLRRVISEKSYVVEIIELSDVQIFEDATNYVCIISLDNDTTMDEFNVRTPESATGKSLTQNGIQSYSLRNSELSEDPWNVIPAPVANILDSIDKNLVTLDEVTKSISQGIDTPKDEVYFVSPEAVEEYDLESEILRPVLKRQDVKRYEPLYTDLKSIYPYRDGQVIPEEQMNKEFPNTWNYLFENE